MSAQLTLSLTNKLAEIEGVSRLVEAFGEQHGLPARVVFDLNLALDEVLTNIISYGYDDGAEHEITVRLSLDGHTLHVEVEDDGRPFNPLEIAEPHLGGPVEERSIGGLGLFLVRKLMSGLAYRRQEGKNVFGMSRTVADVPVRQHPK